MYVTRLRIQNIQSIEEMDLVFPEEHLPGWHVLLGDNGSGKTAAVRSLALALAGPEEAMALRQPWSDWLRLNSDKGSIQVDVLRDDGLDEVSGHGDEPGLSTKGSLVFARSRSQRGPEVDLSPSPAKLKSGAWRTFWGDGGGWFSASFGPFRRFSGGAAEWEDVYRSNPRLAPHLSAFGEDVAFSDVLGWLKFLAVDSLVDKGRQDSLLDDLRRFLNEGKLIPHGARIGEIRPNGVLFIDGNGCLLETSRLSDGYRSILSMMFELIRLMVATYDSDVVFRSVRNGDMKIDLPGVVAIDEVDAHLHPAWQHRIGPWFRRYFPNIQFIVTTHSPIVCQAAEQGSIWRLPSPGTDEKARRVEGLELERLVNGNVLEAFGTDLFGMGVTRSEVSRNNLQRLAILNTKARRNGLSSEEAEERQRLRATMPTNATDTSAAE